MNRNDQKIESLKIKIEKKIAMLEEKLGGKRFKPLTNMVYKSDLFNTQININAASDTTLNELKVWFSLFEDDTVLNGFSVLEWRMDIENKLISKELAEWGNKLIHIQNKLSDEKKLENELDNLENLLDFDCNNNEN